MSRSVAKRSKKSQPPRKPADPACPPVAPCQSREVFSKPYLVLYTGWPPASDEPEPLEIPAAWASLVNGDFTIDGAHEFMTREEAMRTAADYNREQLDECDRTHNLDLWAMVFVLGEPCRGSYIMIEGGAAAEMLIKTSVEIVRPTEDEIERFGKRAVSRKAVANG